MCFHQQSGMKSVFKLLLLLLLCCQFAAAEDDPRVSEEEGVAFPLARGVLIGGDGSIGIGRPAGKSSVSVHILC